MQEEKKSEEKRIPTDIDWTDCLLIKQGDQTLLAKNIFLHRKPWENLKKKKKDGDKGA